MSVDAVLRQVYLEEVSGLGEQNGEHVLTDPEALSLHFPVPAHHEDPNRRLVIPGWNEASFAFVVGKQYVQRLADGNPSVRTTRLLLDSDV